MHFWRKSISAKYSTKSASAFTNGEETTDYIISKMLSNLSCLVFDRSSVMKYGRYRFAPKMHSFAPQLICANTTSAPLIFSSHGYHLRQ
jgi:hypothetical protein